MTKVWWLNIEIREPNMHNLETIHMEALKAAREGNVDELYCLIEKNPQLLNDFDNFKFVHSPLHEAARCGQTHFAIEVMNLHPSLAKKLNPQGLSPLDFAVLEESKEERRQIRKNETAEALIKLDPELIRVKGKKLMTPMHHAVMENNQELLAEFLCACPGSIDDRTNRFQNAMHLAVENKKLEIFDLLLGWLKRSNREDVLNCEDDDGNNPLHIAVQKEEVQIVKKLIEKVHRTCRNNKKLTAFDIAKQNQNTAIKHLLMPSKVRNDDSDLATGTETLTEYMKSREGCLERVLRKYFYAAGEMSLDMCNIFLIIAVLIVTAALDGILSPPGGVWQGNGVIPPNLKVPASASDIYKYQMKPHHHMQHFVGKAVTSGDIFDAFKIGNTMAFVTASMVMFFVIPFRPYSIPLFISLLFLTYSYLKAMVIVSEPSAVTRSLTIITWFLICASFTLRIGIFFAKSLFEDYWWMPRFSVPVINYLYVFPINRVTNTLLNMSARFKFQQKVCNLRRK